MRSMEYRRMWDQLAERVGHSADTLRVHIYGDSLMKGTLLLEADRYRFAADDFVEEALDGLPVEVINHARFGATTEKGLSILERDLARGIEGDIALIAFGGNDSDNDWDLVASAPNEDHPAKVPMPRFIENMVTLAKKVYEAKMLPVFMTMPPIDADRWLNWCCRNGADRNAIDHWLGGVQEMSRFHEWYSDTVAQLAYENDIALVDVRRAFLPSRRFSTDLVGRDGIHLTEKGYKLLFRTLADALRNSVLGNWIKENLPQGVPTQTGSTTVPCA